MALGYVLAESLRPGSRLADLPLALTAIERYDVPSATREQPDVWTRVEFEFPAEEAERVAGALAAALDARGGWYSHFTVAGETFVVFADRVFRYRSGDRRGRAEAAAHGRAVGVPEEQLDWDEDE